MSVRHCRSSPAAAPAVRAPALGSALGSARSTHDHIKKTLGAAWERVRSVDVPQIGQWHDARACKRDMTLVPIASLAHELGQDAYHAILENRSESGAGRASKTLRIHTDSGISFKVDVTPDGHRVEAEAVDESGKTHCATRDTTLCHMHRPEEKHERYIDFLVQAKGDFEGMIHELQQRVAA